MIEHDEPTVYTVERDDKGNLRLTRRVLLAVSGTAVAVSACSSDDDTEDKGAQSPEPTTQLASDKCVPVKGHVSAVKALAFSKTWLASGSTDKTVKLWAVPGGRWRATFPEQSGTVLSLAAAPDGALLSGSSDGTIRRRSMPAGKVLTTFKGSDAKLPAALVVAPNGKWIAYTDPNEAVAIRTIADRSLIASLRHTDDVYALDVTDDGTRLASAGRDAKVLVWSMPDGALIKTLKGHLKSVRALAWAPDASWLASGGDEGEVLIWSVGDAEVRMSLHDSLRTPVKALAAARDGSWLAAGLTNGTVMVWSMPGGALRATLDGHTAGIESLAVSVDGLTLASGDKNGTILLWSMPNGTALGCLLDVESNKKVEGLKIQVDEKGKLVTYTLPCGSPIPAGALCTCNCVTLTGSSCSCVGHKACSCVGDTCSCVGHKVCTCVGDTCSCVGHKTTGKVTHYWHPN